MNNNEMLENIRRERPGQIIDKVLSFAEREDGLYAVNTIIKYSSFNGPLKSKMVILPYPIEKYTALSKVKRRAWPNEQR